jgi:hypothetical protein
VTEVVAFDLQVKPQFKLLETSTLRCVELVYEGLVKICHNCTGTVRAIHLLGSIPSPTPTGDPAPHFDFRQLVEKSNFWGGGGFVRINQKGEKNFS